MSRLIDYAIPFNGSDDMINSTTIDKYPDLCPICHVSVEPVFVYAAYSITDNFEVIFRCTNQSCSSHFISYYDIINDKNSVANFRYSHSYPITIESPMFAEEIKQVSPLFEEIYGQAYSAEKHQLNHIAGMGYRKALEFLIKDYLIYFLEKDKETIEKKLLGKCIKEDVTSENIKLVAERAVWIGNDETHYVRKWQDKDISDLKKLITVAVNWISSEIITKKVVEEMK